MIKPKRPGGHAAPERSYNLRLPPTVYEVLRRHAFERNVSMNQLVSDILRLWVIAATDPTDPLFSPQHLGVRLPEPPQELYPGYTDGLVFVLPAEAPQG